MRVADGAVAQGDARLQAVRGHEGDGQAHGGKHGDEGDETHPRQRRYKQLATPPHARSQH